MTYIFPSFKIHPARGWFYYPFFHMRHRTLLRACYLAAKSSIWEPCLPTLEQPVQLNPPPFVPVHYHAGFYGCHRVVEGEVSDRLNGKLIIIIIIGPVHSTHIPNYTEDGTHPAVAAPDLSHAWHEEHEVLPKSSSCELHVGGSIAQGFYSRFLPEGGKTETKPNKTHWIPRPNLHLCLYKWQG